MATDKDNIKNGDSACQSSFTSLLSHIDFLTVRQQDIEILLEDLQESREGIHQVLHFLGETLLTFSRHQVLTFTPESLCQLGNGLISLQDTLSMLTALNVRVSQEYGSRKSKSSKDLHTG